METWFGHVWHQIYSQSLGSWAVLDHRFWWNIVPNTKNRQNRLFCHFWTHFGHICVHLDQKWQICANIGRNTHIWEVINITKYRQNTAKYRYFVIFVFFVILSLFLWSEHGLWMKMGLFYLVTNERVLKWKVLPKGTFFFICLVGFAIKYPTWPWWTWLVELHSEVCSWASCFLLVFNEDGVYGVC